MDDARTKGQWSTSSSRLIRVALLFCVALGIRLYGLGRQALWIDELQRVTWAKGYEFDRIFDVLAGETGARLSPSSLGQALTVVSRHNPPLNGAILNLWFRTIGDGSDAIARLPSAIFSAASVPVTYLALRGPFGEVAALLTAALVGLSPFHVYYAQEVNHYALAFLCVAITFYYYLRYVDEARSRDGVGWAVAAAIAFYAHYYSGIVFLFQWLGILPEARARRMSLLRVVGPPLLMALLILPYAPLIREQLEEMTSTAQIGAFLGVQYFVDRTRANLAMPYLGERGDYSTWLEALPVMALSLGLTAFGISRLHGPRRWLLLLNVAGPWCFVTLAFLLGKTNSILWPRYQLFFTFALFASAGVALSALGRGAILAGAAILAALAVGHVHQHEIVREDWRSVAAAIERAGAVDDPVLVYRQNLVYSVARYLRTANRLFGIGPTPRLEETLVAIEASEPAGGGIWYASAWPEQNDMETRMHEFFRHHYEWCEPVPVNPGVVSLRLTHCSGAQAPEDTLEGVPTWWLPRGGPLLEGAWVEKKTASGVGGWAYSSGGIPTIRVVIDGKIVAEARHPGIARPDVSAVFAGRPRELTEPSGFFVPLHVEEAAAQRAHVFCVRADGTLLELPGDPRP